LRLYAGETLEVLQKNDHGWWYGMANRGGNLHKGYFPKNYVRAIDVAPNVPKPPPRPSRSMEPVTPPVSEVTKLADDVSTKLNVERGPSFSLKSLTAFDDLMERGFAVEVTDSPPGSGGKDGGMAFIDKGMRVELTCCAKIWDGASTATKEFANGTVNFVTGESQVTVGLDLAVQKLKQGQKATITCSPAMAYGAAGNPPSVPPNSFVIFEVHVLSASKATTSGAAPAPGAAHMLFDSGVTSTRKVKGAVPDNRRGSRVMFVSKKEGGGGAEKGAPTAGCADNSPEDAGSPLQLNNNIQDA
jgi:hypothetical protein